VRIEDVAGSFNEQLYNSLWTVEAADAAVRKDDALHGALGVLGEVFLAHGMQDRFGVSLLHKHNAVQRGERMIENEETFEGAEALVTRPTSSDANFDRAVPSVWALQDDRFMPLEYTTDPLAAELFQGDVPGAFLGDFRQAAKASPLGDLLGLSIVSRRLFAAAPVGEIGMEYTNLTPRSSIVVMADRSVGLGKSLETRWRFQGGLQANARCIQDCVTRCHLDANNVHEGARHWAPEHIPS
jgi:hypothetical protein